MLSVVLQVATTLAVLSTTVLSVDFTCCIGDFGDGGDGSVWLNTDRKWCCDECNCKDYSDAQLSASDTCCTCQGSTQVPVAEMHCCVGDYGFGGDGDILLNAERKWCCAYCNCRDFLDSDWCAEDQCCDEWLNASTLAAATTQVPATTQSTPSNTYESSAVFCKAVVCAFLSAVLCALF